MHFLVADSEINCVLFLTPPLRGRLLYCPPCFANQQKQQSCANIFLSSGPTIRCFSLPRCIPYLHRRLFCVGQQKNEACQPERVPFQRRLQPVPQEVDLPVAEGQEDGDLAVEQVAEGFGLAIAQAAEDLGLDLAQVVHAMGLDLGEGPAEERDSDPEEAEEEAEDDAGLDLEEGPDESDLDLDEVAELVGLEVEEIEAHLGLDAEQVPQTQASAVLSKGMA